MNSHIYKNITEEVTPKSSDLGTGKKKTQQFGTFFNDDDLCSKPQWHGLANTFAV